MKIKTPKNFLVFSLFLAGFFLQSGFSQTISLSPTSGHRGTSFGVTVTGSGTSFNASTTCIQIVASPTTLSLSAVNVMSATKLTGTLMIPVNHNVGTYDVRVYRGESGPCTGTLYNCTNCFKILCPLVSNTGGSGTGSLREAFGCTSAGDTIKFDPALNNTTITLNLPVIANSNQVVLYSNLANNITITSVQIMGNIQPFISTTADLTMSGLKLQGNTPESLIFKAASGGSINLIDCNLNLVTIDMN